uniref:Uncharacterized protein n=1 Tax=Arundo donax TaxID=35708 RepID=A0A0A9DHM4_ARUDO
MSFFHLCRQQSCGRSPSRAGQAQACFFLPHWQQSTATSHRDPDAVPPCSGHPQPPQPSSTKPSRATQAWQQQMAAQLPISLLLLGSLSKADSAAQEVNSGRPEHRAPRGAILRRMRCGAAAEIERWMEEARRTTRGQNSFFQVQCIFPYH